MTNNKSYGVGFRLVSKLETSGLRYYGATGALAIQQGDALVITSGLLALATADIGITFAGIAHTENTAAESTAGAKVAVIPPLKHYQFKVKVGSEDLITLAQVGLTYDIDSEVSIDENDTTWTVWGFFVDEIDVSPEAIDANAYGYAIGHFQHKT